MRPDDPTLNAELRRDEGVRKWPYFDTMGIKTIGVGHNMEASTLPDGWSFPLTDHQIDSLLAADLVHVFSGLDANIGWWRNLSYPRQRVLANMAFNMGVAGLMKFKNTLFNIQHGDYEEAAKGMLSSKWASQVGKRAERLAEMMRAG